MLRHNLGFATLTGPVGVDPDKPHRRLTCRTGDELQAALNGKDALPLVITLAGQINGANTAGSDLDLSNVHDVEIIGAGGDSSDIVDVGLHIHRASSNIVLANLNIAKVKEGGKDAIGIEGDANRIVIEHCTLSGDLAAGKDFYDGLLDIKRGAHSISIVDCLFENHHKAVLIGHSDAGPLSDWRVTILRSRFSRIGSRCPSIRGGQAHVANCLFEDVTVSGVNTRMSAKVLLESSVFRRVENPVVSRDSKTVGLVHQRDVLFEGCTYGKPGAGEANFEGGRSTTDYVPPYALPISPAEQLPALVMASAGCIKAGAELPPAPSVIVAPPLPPPPVVEPPAPPTPPQVPASEMAGALRRLQAAIGDVALLMERG